MAPCSTAERSRSRLNKHVTRGDQRIGHQCAQDWRRIGEAGCPDDHSCDQWHVAAHPSQEQGPQRLHEFALHGAAEAAGAERDHVVMQCLDQQVIEADLAELMISTAVSASSGSLSRRFSNLFCRHRSR